MKDNPFKIQEGSIADANVRGFLEHRQSGDYIPFTILDRKHHLGRFFDLIRLHRLYLVFLVVFLLLLGRSFYLQVIRGSDFRAMAEGNRISTELIKANRGLIFDRFGEPLVKNVSYFFLYLRPDRLSAENQGKLLWSRLANFLGLDQEKLSLMIKENNQPGEEVLIYENLPYAQAVELMVWSEAEPALRVSYEPRRWYYPELGLSHVLGYLGVVNKDDLDRHKDYQYNDRIGKTGLEYIYEDILRGRDGAIQYEVDALFRKQDIISRRPAQDGQDIYLTIDAKAQKKLYEILQTNARAFAKNKIAAIVADPTDGEMLAMSSLPSFDNNIFTTVLAVDQYQQIIADPDTPMLNRAISGTYPLGSVFKLVVGAAALQEKIIDANFRVESVGGIEVGGHFFPDWRPQGHGWTDIDWAIADSVNTFFYSVGGGNNQWLDRGLGVDKIIEYASEFGFGQSSGLDINGEVPGFLPSREWKETNFNERWYLGDTYNLSIGQGFLAVTPLQGLNLISYFAAQGQVYQPHFIKEIDNQGQIEVYQPKTFLTKLLDSDNLNIVRQGLRRTVTQGTAQSLQSVAVPVAGKTGTAQFRQDKTPHSWFAGFAPYDQPQIALIVLVEEGGDQGLAVKIAREFMEWYFSQ